MAFTKLKIAGAAAAGGGGESVDVMINPETIKHSRSIKLEEKSVGNTKGSATQFAGMGPDTLEFTLELENTGALSSSGDIPAMIEKISKLVYEYDGSIHRSKYATVTYGGIEFEGQLENLTVDYKMFDQSGAPMRASIAFKFQKQNEVGATGNTSPDMTHGFTIREGDTLPMLCKQVYGKMDYYLAVAEHNGLTNFRDLEIGSVIEFPPMER
jgi:nucleoid-associated protein YgaU